MKIAIVLTCFNRREKTAACLDSLIDASKLLGDGFDLKIIVTDDGSRDGTSEMLQTLYPEVEVLHGDGNLYWNGGMRLAYGRALEGKYDFYLWVNDDTNFYPDFMGKLFATYKRMVSTTGKDGLIVGSTQDSFGKVSYGGLYRPDHKRPLKFSLINPNLEPIPCESCNGNCLLISASAANLLGNLEESFVHSMGDMDYGLRATKAGIPLWVAPGFVGECGNDHPLKGSYLDTSLPFMVRWRKALSAKELNPRAWGTFCKRHSGFLWPLHWVWPYAKIVISSITSHGSDKK